MISDFFEQVQIYVEIDALMEMAPKRRPFALPFLCDSTAVLPSCGVLSSALDTGTLALSAVYAATGLTLSDAQVAQFCTMTVARMDAENVIGKG